MQYDLFDGQLNGILSSPSYPEFRRLLVASGCSRCPLHQGRTNLVPDRGNPDTDLVLIGEGPGADEDAQGRAFVGRAGQMLDKILQAIDIDSNRNCLIINVVKCRPPGNRAPTREEAETCSVFLDKQIELVRPRMVALLGATALKHLDPTRKSLVMAEEAGSCFHLPRWPEVEFVVLYHPAALLYDPRLKPRMAEHVQKLRDRLAELRRGVAAADR
jgi:DNA polymerase